MHTEQTFILLHQATQATHTLIENRLQKHSYLEAAQLLLNVKCITAVSSLYSENANQQSSLSTQFNFKHNTHVKYEYFW